LANWLSSAANWIGRTLSNLPDLISISRITFWLGFATFAWMLLRGRIRRSSRRRAQASPSDTNVDTTGDDEVNSWKTLIENRPAHLYVPPAFVIRCLLLFNVVFALENVLDVRYLFDPSKLPAGTNYTEYVH